jgi:hypothetical protein
MTRSPSSDGIRGRSSTVERLIPNQVTPGQHRSAAPNIKSLLEEAFLNPETSIVCLDCGITYTMSEKEYHRFKELAATVQNFRMPRRCSECRRARRNQAPVTAKAAAPTYPPAAATSAPVSMAQMPFKEAAPLPPVVVAAPPKTEPEKKEEILFVLATKDFEDLVNGRPIVWRGVRLVLADIGFGTMKKAIEDAELERAKKLVKANGH